MVKLGSGCGPGKLGDLVVPDYPFGQCCKIHDLAYDRIVDKLEVYYHSNFINFVTSNRPQDVYDKVLNVIKTKALEYKVKADEQFLRNMLTVADSLNIFVRWWYKRKAKLYYRAVTFNPGRAVDNYVYRLFLKRLGGVA